MATIEIYYHDITEVDPKVSWTRLSKYLKDADLIDVKDCRNPKVLDLFLYARPDAVIVKDEIPVVSLEQTMMNPSGHNIPQRFSFSVRASELGVNSILYYPKASRRTFSDPNKRNLNVRVPLAQIKMMKIYEDSLALSMFWPVDDNNLPTTIISKHHKLAEVIDLMIEENDISKLKQNKMIREVIKEMGDSVLEYSTTSNYRHNSSFRAFFKDGYAQASANGSENIDPPSCVTAHCNDSLLKKNSINGQALPGNSFDKKYSLSLKATPTKNKKGSEHPWPGYFSMIYILYCLEKNKSGNHNLFNMIYFLPVLNNDYAYTSDLKEMNTSKCIEFSFSDYIFITDNVLKGKFKV